MKVALDGPDEVTGVEDQGSLPLDGADEESTGKDQEGGCLMELMR